MRSVTVDDAQAELSRLIDAVGGGEIVMITRHGEPVAVLTPMATAEIARRREISSSEQAPVQRQTRPKGAQHQPALPSACL